MNGDHILRALEFARGGVNLRYAWGLTAAVVIGLVFCGVAFAQSTSRAACQQYGCDEPQNVGASTSPSPMGSAVPASAPQPATAADAARRLALPGGSLPTPSGSSATAEPSTTSGSGTPGAPPGVPANYHCDDGQEVYFEGAGENVFGCSPPDSPDCSTGVTFVCGPPDSSECVTYFYGSDGTLVGIRDACGVTTREDYAGGVLSCVVLTDGFENNAELSCVKPSPLDFECGHTDSSPVEEQYQFCVSGIGPVWEVATDAADDSSQADEAIEAVRSDEADPGDVRATEVEEGSPGAPMGTEPGSEIAASLADGPADRPSETDDAATEGTTAEDAETAARGLAQASEHDTAGDKIASGSTSVTDSASASVSSSGTSSAASAEEEIERSVVGSILPETGGVPFAAIGGTLLLIAGAVTGRRIVG